MKLLEDYYNEILLNEALRQVNITPELIQKELESQYNQTIAREKALGHKVSIEKFHPEEGDVDVIRKVLLLLRDIDKSCRLIFQKYSNNASAIMKGIISLEEKWRALSSRDIPKGFRLKQAANITLVKLLNSILNTKLPVEDNPEGWPVYPYHLVVRFIVMNILEELFKAKKIDQKTKEDIETSIFDEITRNQIQKEINEYLQRTKHSINIPKEEPELKPKEETETSLPETPSKEERLAMIRRLMQQ